MDQQTPPQLPNWRNNARGHIPGASRPDSAPRNIPQTPTGQNLSIRRGSRQLALVPVAFDGIYGRVSAVLHNTPPRGTPDPIHPPHEPIEPERQTVAAEREPVAADEEHVLAEAEPVIPQRGPEINAGVLLDPLNDRAPSERSEDSAETAAEQLPAVLVEDDEEEDDNTAAEPERPEGAAPDDEEEAYIPPAQPRQPQQPNPYPILNRPLPAVFNRHDPWQDLYVQGVDHLRRAALQIDNLDYVRILRTPEGGMALQGGREEARVARDALRSAEADIHDAYTYVLLGIQAGGEELRRLQAIINGLEAERDRIMMHHHTLRLNFETIRAHNGALSLRIEHLEEERARMMGYNEE